MFRIKRGKGQYDNLIFTGAWEMSKHYIYRYQKQELITKQKRIHTPTFKGYWDTKDKTRMSYVINRTTGSNFDFKTL